MSTTTTTTSGSADGQTFTLVKLGRGSGATLTMRSTYSNDGNTLMKRTYDELGGAGSWHCLLFGASCYLSLDALLNFICGTATVRQPTTHTYARSM